MKGTSVPLDPSVRSKDFLELDQQLRSRIVGQDEAVMACVETVHKFLAGFAPPNRPVANVLLLGPTGVGKTRLLESMAEVLFGDQRAMLKIDCAEFQASHDIAKLIGAPPGYVGHQERTQILSQERLDKYHTKDLKLSIVLFDEIEKANEALFQLLLGVLDKGLMTNGQGQTIDFTRSMIFMTSNLGAHEMEKALTHSFGFQMPKNEPGSMDARLHAIAIERARKNFRPEFMNRLDRTIVFNTLKEEHLRNVFRIEMGQVQKRILTADNHQKFVVAWDPGVEDYILREGTSAKYGARHLKRAVEKSIVTPISYLVMSGQLELGDVLRIHVKNDQLYFDKIPADVVAHADREEWATFKSALSDLGPPSQRE